MGRGKGGVCFCELDTIAVFIIIIMVENPIKCFAYMHCATLVTVRDQAA